MSDPLETEEEVNRLHNEKMARRKAARDRMLATKTEERGLLIVHTGTGKGKSTAAFGMVLRCLGHGMRVGIVQFVKGVWGTGERVALERFGDLVTCRAMGEGFTWDTQDRARDIAAARAAWELAKAMIADPSYRLVLLDELNIVLRYDYLPLDEVVAALKAKPRDLHIVVTGRNAKPELIEAADLVTEMTLVKHPFRSRRQSPTGHRVLTRSGADAAGHRLGCRQVAAADRDGARLHPARAQGAAVQAAEHVEQRRGDRRWRRDRPGAGVAGARLRRRALDRHEPGAAEAAIGERRADRARWPGLGQRLGRRVSPAGAEPAAIGRSPRSRGSPRRPISSSSREPAARPKSICARVTSPIWALPKRRTCRSC